jgi:maltose alpha-D-glucosyltransferase/alpha-amylase
MPPHPNLPFPSWLENAVFYEIYPQSFYDSNGDGIGDIPGIELKLDYLQSLGVNAVWINPCFESPFQDAGYDVSDYLQVAPRYGTNQDLKRLFTEAHRRGIRILLDLVPGHTSIEHPWFKASSRHAPNPYSDYYIWTDNAWTWEVPGYRAVSGFSERDGSYITNFFYFQPALNYGFANSDPAQPWQLSVDAPGPQLVRQELKHIIRFWLDQGASGFRVDMAFSLVKGDPGARQTIKLWQEVRHMLDEEYPDAVLLSEWGVPERAIAGGFHMDFCLPFAMPGYTSLLRKPYGPGPGTDPYGFSFFDPRGKGNILEFLDEFNRHHHAIDGKGLIVLPTGNHDINPRLSKGRTFADIELVYLFMMTMPVVPCIYYGDEIAMRTLDGLPSKEGGYSRTGSRTPMQWAEIPNAGFSSGPEESLYLPVDTRLDRPTVATQEAQPGSLLNKIRQIVAMRSAYLVLQATASFSTVYAQPGEVPLVYTRSDDNQTALVAINPANYPVEIPLPISFSSINGVLYGPQDALSQSGNHWKLYLPPISGGVYLIQ